MAKNRKDGDPKKRKAGDETRERPKPGEGPPLQRDPDADPVKIHREYVERRVGGGEPPTPEAYERAIGQWHQLPGAVRVPPTELSGDDAKPAPKEEEGDEDEQKDEQSGKGPGV